MAETRITVFSDFACPYSYITETGLRRVVEDGDQLEVVYRAFELFPEPVELGPPLPDGEALEALLELAAAEELKLADVKFRPRTRKAHEAARFALEHGRQAELRGEIFRAYWVEERDIGRIDVLMELAQRVGLEAEELKIALDIDRYTEEVIHDNGVAQRLRIPGSPTVYVGTGPSAQLIAGAHSSRRLRSLINHAIRTWAEDLDDG